MDQWQRAMEIWLPDLPDIPIQEWYHRIPMNTDLLDRLADRGRPLCQRRLLAPDLPARAQPAEAAQ